MDALWDQMCKRMVEVIGQGLKGSSDGEVFLGCKTEILLFVQTLEVSSRKRIPGAGPVS